MDRITQSLSKIKWPSKKVVAFVGTISTVLGARFADSYWSKLERKKLAGIASKRANEPLPAGKRLEKYIVYLEKPDNNGIFGVRRHFEKYIKPVWDAAAIDLEVIEALEPGDIHKKAQELLNSADKVDKVVVVGQEEGWKELSTALDTNQWGLVHMPYVAKSWLHKVIMWFYEWNEIRRVGGEALRVAQVAEAKYMF